MRDVWSHAIHLCWLALLQHLKVSCTWDTCVLVYRKIFFTLPIIKYFSSSDHTLITLDSRFCIRKIRRHYFAREIKYSDTENHKKISLGSQREYAQNFAKSSWVMTTRLKKKALRRFILDGRNHRKGKFLNTYWVQQIFTAFIKHLNLMFLLCDNLLKVETTQQVNTTSLWRDEERQDSYLWSDTFQSTWLLQVRYKTAENEDCVNLWSVKVLRYTSIKYKCSILPGWVQPKKTCQPMALKGGAFWLPRLYGASFSHGQVSVCLFV